MTPFFWLIFRRVSPQWLKCLGAALLVLLYFTQTSLHVPGFTSLSFFYFGIGSALSLMNKSITEFFSYNRYLFLFVFGVLFFTEVAFDGHNTDWGNLLYPFFVFSGVYTLFGIFITYNLNWGGQDFSFFIFAFHIFILRYVVGLLSKIAYLVLGINPINSLEIANRYPILIIAEYLLKIAITVLISIIVYSILKRKTPKLCKILCGR